MILRTVHIFSVIVLTVEALLFPDINFHPASVNQADKKFHRLHSTFYPLFGHPSQPIRQPAGIQFSDKLNKGEGKFAGFVSLRSRNPCSIFVDENLSNIHQKKAQKVRRLGQQIRNSVQHYEEGHRRRMQHVKEMLNDKFRFDKAKNRLKQALANKKTSLKKLQSFGRCFYIGEPYHTMNDDHKIVKKPSADFHLYSQTNVGTPILASVPAIQPIATQYPAVPEVTTSVNFHQESEVTATIAGYVFPVTSTATYTPDVIETTDIGNSIGQEKTRTPQLPLDTSNSTETMVLTTIFTDPETESEILEAYSEQETTFAAVDVSSRIKNEDFNTVKIDQGTTTEIDSSLSPLLSTQTTWQTERIEPPASQATLLLDLMSGIQVKPVTSLVIDVESTTTEISPTFSANTSSIDDNFTSHVIDTDTTIAEIVSTSPSILPTRKTLGTEETTMQPQARRTTIIANEIFETTNTDFTSPATDPETTDETIFTFPFINLTDTAMATNAISTTIDTTFDGSTIDEKITMELVSTLPSTISTETTAWLPPASEIDPILNVLFGFGYNRFPSFTDEVEIETTAADATFPSTTQTETITIFEEISTTDSALYTHAVNDGETTTEIVSTLPSTISPEITSWPRITSLADVSYGFGYNHFQSFTDELETTIGVDSTVSSLISTETTMMITERSTTVYPVTDDPTIETKTTEIFLNFSPTISPETTTIFEETSTVTDSHFHRSTTDEGITNDVLLTVSSTVQTDSTVTPVSEIASLLDALPSLGYNHFTDLTNAPETTTRVHSALVSTIPTETTTMLIERLMSVVLASDKPTLDVEITTEIVSLLPLTILDEISTTMDPAPYIITTDGHTTSEIVSTFPSTISLETTSWPPTALEITPLEDVSSRFGYYHFPSSTDTVGKTTEVYSTFTSTNAAETTTTYDEKLTTVELALNNSTIDTERTSEIVPMFPYEFSGETMTSLGKISTAKPFDYSSIDEATTIQIISTFLTEAPIVEYNYLTDSSIEPEITIRDDSKPSYTIPTETITIVTERWTTSDIENSIVTDTSDTMEADSIVESITTEILEEVPVSKGSPDDSTTIYEETSTKVIPTSSSVVLTETIMNVREISRAVHPASSSYTDAGKTTTEKIVMLSTPISIDTTTPSIDEYDHIGEQNFEYLEGNQVNSGVRIGRLLHENSDLVIPHVTHTAEEAPDEKSLLNIIPLIIDELRQDNVTPEEEYTLSQVFRDLWPPLKEESKRKPGELMDHKLAILIFEAGQRLSDNERLARDVATDNLRLDFVKLKNITRRITNFYKKPIEMEQRALSIS